ncbi:ABC transporter permease [Oceanobacillus jeddahense]|uniref:ABC transporter permease n=1 Tax=Oceanobacillus jeddahense TaxID=1462527 RepID=UPI000595A79B|nr:ABC transporter permease [Oceanobacillus jeddahense]
MLKLMKLEFTKHHISQYIKGALIWTFIIFISVALMAWGSRNEVEPMFPDYPAFMSLANIFIKVVFITFSAVVLSRLVIDEYKNKTILLLFAYPLQRKKLIQAKLLIVLLFCFLSIIISTLIINLLVYWISPHLFLFEEPVQAGEMLATAPSVLIQALMAAGVSLIPLFFGMRKKSTATTITWAVIIGVLINATVSDGGSQVSLSEIIIIPGILCLFGLFIGYLSFRKINKLDVV